MFFEFHQNNSGGGFDFDAERGISTNVIVEADDAEHANYRAKRIGLYFDGVENGDDCECCGDRWSEAWRTDGDPVPSHYGTPLDEAKYLMKWQAEGRPETFVHYSDGRIVAHCQRERKA
ncbi:DUF7296 family protein [Streptomyces sp. SP17KL33]|uniref:DUF7296 family protein n=1 Tax=Streptomyces sp. SP17KL33 TaxID=3002534 RepID=UPI002E7895E3|nr:hypothetical protein [Streptomyces sp. SP17KL33]MEE1835778.1 hypothetical protein [Streptomyces sp. SP17KL33]